MLVSIDLINCSYNICTVRACTKRLDETQARDSRRDLSLLGLD